MKITIIYDNEVYKKGLKSDWGFSSLVEVENTLESESKGKNKNSRG